MTDWLGLASATTISKLSKTSPSRTAARSRTAGSTRACPDGAYRTAEMPGWISRCATGYTEASPAVSQVFTKALLSQQQKFVRVPQAVLGLLEYGGNALADADAHRRQCVARGSAPQLHRGGASQARARGPKR